MTKNIATHTAQQSLRYRLREYGLNPADWRLETSASDTETFFVQSKQDPEFILTGKTQRDSKIRRIISLELLSL